MLPKFADSGAGEVPDRPPEEASGGGVWCPEASGLGAFWGKSRRCKEELARKKASGGPEEEAPSGLRRVSTGELAGELAFGMASGGPAVVPKRRVTHTCAVRRGSQCVAVIYRYFSLRLPPPTRAPFPLFTSGLTLLPVFKGLG